MHVHHDDVIKWKHFPRHWPFVRGIHQSPVNSPHKGQWRGALMFSLICVWINGWVNNREAGDFRPYLVHYDVTVMHVTWPHGVQPMQHKIQYVWITKNPHWTDVHIYELQLKAKCHKLHKLEKEKLKQLQELNRHLILRNFIVKKRNCAVIWPNWTQNWFQIQ